MKRFLLLFVVLLLIALPALAEGAGFSTFDYVDGHAGSHYLCYSFPDIRLYMPIEWEGRITVESDTDGASFYQTASHEKYLEEGIAGGGFLFGLRASADEGFRELPAYEYLGFSDNAGLHFYLLLPSDYPAWPDGDEIQAEYDEMSGQIRLVVEQAKIGPNMNFYTDPNMVVEDGNGLG